MATNIPPHNLGEVIDAVVHLIDNPEATNEDLMEFVKGPDFPTGALILGRSGINDAYTTGRGSIKLRAVAEIEETRRGDHRIVVTELPYQTSVEVIDHKIADLVNDCKVEGIRDVRNESSEGNTRLVVELRRDANVEVVLNQLYKHTPLQTSFRSTCWRWSTTCPGCSICGAALTVYVDHQIDVIPRRTEFRLRKASERAHIVEGLVKALDMIDAIVALIRGAVDVDAAREGLMGAVRVHRDPGPLHPRHAAACGLPSSRVRSSRRVAGAACQPIAELRDDPRRAPPSSRGHQRPSSPRCATSSPTNGAPQLTVDFGDLDTLDLIDDEEVVVVLSTTRATSRPSPPTRSVVRDVVGEGSEAGTCAQRGLRRAPAHHDRALVPVVLLEPGGCRIGSERTRSP